MSGVYLDYAATTPVDPAVARSMVRCLEQDGIFGNPSSTHQWGRAARAAIDTAREEVAALLRARAEDIIFTSGATEANNLALKGAAHFYAERGRHLVTTATEHKAVVDVCRELGFSGFEVTFVQPQADGTITAERIGEALRPDTTLVSVMHANNETGVINDVAQIGTMVRAQGALMHVDAAQTAGKLPLDVDSGAFDLVSLSAHKNHGPKGVGALWVRRRPRIRLHPLLHGGGHERGLRAGTLATHQIVGMGAACRIAAERRETDQAHATTLGERLLAALDGEAGWQENGRDADRLPGIRNLRFAGIDGEVLAAELAERVALSTGSACTTGSTEPSHVLRAMGQDAATAAEAVRLSWGRMTSAADMDEAATALVDAVRRLRQGVGAVAG